MDGATLWTLIGFLLAAATSALSITTQVKNKKLQQLIVSLQSELAAARSDLSRLGDKIAQFKDYAKRTAVYDPRYLDVLMLGPKNAGKSSLCELWLKPWADIDAIPHTPNWWDHDVAVHEGEKYSERDSLFDVERTYIPQFRLRIRDYAGDDHVRSDALKELRQLSDVVLVLMFTCSQGREVDQVLSPDQLRVNFSRNQDYFNSHFLDQLASLPRLSKNVKKVFVVFNKIDLLPPDWNRARRRSELRDGHKLALERLSHSFGKIVDDWYVSTYDNTQTINLLGGIAKLLLGTERLPAAVEERLKTLGADPRETPRK